MAAIRAADPAPDAEPVALTAHEAAQRLRCSERSVRTLLAEDPGFPRFYLGRLVRIPAKGLEAWVEEAARKERARTSRAVEALKRVGPRSR
jgi:excisionase family DNA binding protein